MARRLSKPRNVRLHSTENHFLVAVSKPFDEASVDYDRLGWLSKDVRYLGEGSQVFIFDRHSFGGRTEEQEQELGRLVYSAVRRGIIRDVEVHPISTRNGDAHE